MGAAVRPGRRRTGVAAGPGAVHHPSVRAPVRSLRPWLGLLSGSALVLTIAVVLAPLHHHTSRVTLALLLVVPVVVAAVLGGRPAALGTAATGALAFALYLPPVGSPRVDLRQDVVALTVFAVVTASVGGVVAGAVSAERRRRDAETDRAAALEVVDRQRTLLLRSVSHDLRTPLATIRAVATELRGPVDYPRETSDELLDLAIDEVDRLDRIVGNLLDLSRVEAGALRPSLQPLELDELVLASTRRLTHLTRHVHLEVAPAAEGATVDGDPTQLDQVVANLVENAVRHVPSGGHVRVTTARRGRWVELAVDDDGPGVPAHLAASLFEPFTSGAPVMPGSPAGTGVGLAICRAVVEAHGGTITAGAGAAGGARFSVMLPCHA